MKTNEVHPVSKKSKDLILKVVILIIAIAAACAVRFSVSYAEIEGTGHTRMWFGISFLTGFVNGIIYRNNFLTPGLFTTTGFTFAVLIRIVFDITFIDPTSHNLLPFELVIWSIMAFIPAVAGSFLSNMIIKLITRIQSKNRSQI